MKIYPDSNILVSIEDQEIKLEELKNVYSFHSNFMYSYIHIQELFEATKNIDELKLKRLKTISELTDNRYIFPDDNQINAKIENPEIVFQTIRQALILFEPTKKIISNFNIDRSGIKKQLDIDVKRINNYSIEDLIKYLDRATTQNLSIGLEDYISLSGDSLKSKISTLFNFLDVIGFWKDKKTDRSNYARMSDSSHTYFASYCDFFISNDLRARNKAKVAYALYKIDTKVLSYDEFLEIKLQKKTLL